MRRELKSIPEPVKKNVTVQEFGPVHQHAAESLINSNLLEHFGTLRSELNPDLFDIGKAYQEGVFLVALLDDGTLVGTGSLMPESPGVGRIARMHTAGDFRRLGIATMMLRSLEERATNFGYSVVVLETTLDWFDAIAFYQRNGYEECSRDQTGIHFRKDL